MSHSQRYRATVAYVGTRFHGWQVQKNAARTVQGVLEEAVARLARAPVRIEGAGRTDAGVHADGQVVHFDLPRLREPGIVRDAVNGRLPEDVRVLEVSLAAADFHARFDARWKEYLYRWSRADVIPPRDAPFVATISRRADAARMRAAAAALPGRRDFSVFAVKLARGDSGVRSLEALTIEESGDELRALFRGGRLSPRHGPLHRRRAFRRGPRPGAGGARGGARRDGRPPDALRQGARAGPDAGEGGIRGVKSPSGS